MSDTSQDARLRFKELYLAIQVDDGILACVCHALGFLESQRLRYPCQELLIVENKRLDTRELGVFMTANLRSNFAHSRFIFLAWAPCRQLNALRPSPSRLGSGLFFPAFF